MKRCDLNRTYGTQARPGSRSLRMVFAAPARLSALVASMVAALALLPIRPAAAAAQSIQISYLVSVIGVPLGMAEARAKLERSHYSIEAEAKLTGIAALIASSKGAATASGSIVAGRVAPADYATTAANSELTRTVRMAMDAGTVKGVDIDPPFEDAPGRVPVTRAQKRHIVDPLSAFVMTVPPDAPLVGPSACNRRIPVFDGYARFDIDLTYVGTRMLRTKGYFGPVSVCAARFVPIAGLQMDRPGTRFMAQNRRLQVWLAPVASARIELPVRISIETMVGMTMLRATQVSFGAPSSQFRGGAQIRRH
ncbi:MAG TPA: DUF3108 domain-containing protein [Beijerinckiaceae bacterium]|nr:DUF3108 domain-containing protein [Beijerinckiaceae bacterium]